jgi:hypothetical protein
MIFSFQIDQVSLWLAAGSVFSSVRKPQFPDFGSVLHDFSTLLYDSRHSAGFALVWYHPPVLCRLGHH